MRIVFIALALLAACGPLAPPSPQPAADSSTAHTIPSAANADALALQQAPAQGAWVEHGHGGMFSALFGTQFMIVCNVRTGALTLTEQHVGAGDRATTLRLITTTQTLELPAQSRSDTIVAQIGRHAPEKTPLISMLGTPGERFAVDTGGAIIVFPWSDAIARTLIACR